MLLCSLKIPISLKLDAVGKYGANNHKERWHSIARDIVAEPKETTQGILSENSLSY